MGFGQGVIQAGAFLKLSFIEWLAPGQHARRLAADRA
jgi:hypothetical protein